MAYYANILTPLLVSPLPMYAPLTYYIGQWYSLMILILYLKEFEKKLNKLISYFSEENNMNSKTFYTDIFLLYNK